MELGNLLMGNSRGQFSVKRGQGFEAELMRLFAACAKGDKDDFEIGYGIHFENKTFMIFPYYWGDCTCGYGEKEILWSKQNEHEDKCYQTLVDKELIEKGWVKKGNILTTKREYKEVKIIEDEIRKKWCKKLGLTYPDSSTVHCTCSHQIKWEQFLKENNHIGCPIDKPNFLYKPNGFEIQWYKYVLRDAYTNKKVSLEEFTKMINACIESIKEEAKEDNNGDKI